MLSLCSRVCVDFSGRRTMFTFSTLKSIFDSRIRRTGNNLHLIRNISRSCINYMSEESQINELVNAISSEELREKLNLEVEMFRQSGYYVPGLITDEQWTEIMLLKNRLYRIKYYKHLFEAELKRAKRAMKRKRKVEEIKSEIEEENQTPSADRLVYGLGKNTLYSNIKPENLNKLYNSWACQSIMFGQKLVLDLSYTDQMSRRELRNCCAQIVLMASENRKNRQPFDFYACNLPHDSEFRHLLMNKFPCLFSDWCQVNFTDESYLDLFPKEKLLYLTPHCDNDMTQFDSDAIYIVGGFVDRANSKQVSSVKAEKEGLRTARLPLNLYLDWGRGGKSLTLDQMVKILLEVKESGDWKKAFTHIPHRKLEKRPKRFHQTLAAYKENIEILHGPH